MRKGMKYLFFVVLLAAPLAICNDQKPSGEVTPGTQMHLAQIVLSADCLTDDQISSNILDLSGDYDEGTRAIETLRNASEKDPECKTKIVAAVMSAMDRSVDIMHKQSDYYLWRYGSELLGDLRAPEALDLLLKHLTMTTGDFSYTMVQQPALLGLQKMGSIAIPGLSEVLRRNKDPFARQSAVYCLSFIREKDAIKAINDAIPYEEDECVAQFMRVTVELLENDSENDANAISRWHSAMMCGGD